MALFSRLFGSNKGDTGDLELIFGSESAAAKHEPGAEINEEVAAVIMAAILSTMDPGATNGLRIRSIKRVGVNAPIWCVAGRQTYISSKL